MDPTKNAPVALKALDRVLETQAVDSPPIRMLACFVPSSRQTREYSSYAMAVSKSIDELNRKHGDVVRYFIGHDMHRTVSALKHYDVLIVNSIRDGMNLVGQNSTLVNEKCGVQILSAETEGADHFGDLVIRLSDPHSVEGTAKCICDALSMTVDNRCRTAWQPREKVKSGSVSTWWNSRIDDVREAFRHGKNTLLERQGRID